MTRRQRPFWILALATLAWVGLAGGCSGGGGGGDIAATDTSGGGDTARQDAAELDAAALDAVVPDGGETPGPDSAQADGAGPDTVGPDTAGPDTARPDTVGPDTVGPDTAGADTAGADTAGADTAGADTAGADTDDPGGCCEADADCNAGAHCIGLAIGSLGVCVAAPAAGTCYERRQCGEGQICEGGRATICVMSSLPELGACVDLPDFCCWDDADCADGRECQGANEGSWGPGECLLVPEAGACYRDAHCPARTMCLGAQPCGCLVDCDDAGPGVCTPVDGSCCFVDEHCGEGLHCVGGQPGGAPGHCTPPLDDGTCWGDEDCADGQVCEGEALCPCDADCDMEDLPGQCQPTLP